MNCGYVTGGYKLRKLSVDYDLGIFSPNFQGLLALLPFPVVILNDEMLAVSDQATAIWLHTISETLREPAVAKLVKRA